MPRNEWSLDGWKLYALTEEWIRENIGDHEAKHANYGWVVDEVEGVICTKVYGDPILVVTIDKRGTVRACEY